VENGEGVVHHKAPYARRQYYGDDLNFSAEKHPLATSHWNEAAKQAGKAKQLAKETQAYIESRGM
jgi:hypothetical protein